MRHIYTLSVKELLERLAFWNGRNVAITPYHAEGIFIIQELRKDGKPMVRANSAHVYKYPHSPMVTCERCGILKGKRFTMHTSYYMGDFKDDITHDPKSWDKRKRLCFPCHNLYLGLKRRYQKAEELRYQIYKLKGAIYDKQRKQQNQNNG